MTWAKPLSGARKRNSCQTNLPVCSRDIIAGKEMSILPFTLRLFRAFARLDKIEASALCEVSCSLSLATTQRFCITEEMENVAAGLSVLLTFTGSSSAQSSATWSTSYEEIITNTDFLPSALYLPAPVQLEFIARLSSSTTFYSLMPGFSNNLTDFANWRLLCSRR